MKITTPDGRTFEGTAAQIVKQMHSLSFGMWPTATHYLAWLARSHDVKLTPDQSEEAAAAEVLRAMVARGALHEGAPDTELRCTACGRPVEAKSKSEFCSACQKGA